MATETLERPRTGGPGSGLGGNWRVIVLNDDHNTFDHVAQTLAAVIPGVTLEQRLPDRRPDPQHRPGDRLVRPARARRALLGAAQRRRADDGAARAGLSRRVDLAGAPGGHRADRPHLRSSRRPPAPGGEPASAARARSRGASRRLRVARRGAAAGAAERARSSSSARSSTVRAERVGDQFAGVESRSRRAACPSTSAPSTMPVERRASRARRARAPRPARSRSAAAQLADGDARVVSCV